MPSYSLCFGGEDGLGGGGGHFELPSMLFNHFDDILVLLILGAGIVVNSRLLFDPLTGGCLFRILFGGRMTRTLAILFSL